MQGCPTPLHLEEFVRGGAIADDLFQHVENCESCGRIVEQLFSASDLSVDTKSLVSTDTARPEDIEFLQQLAENPPQDVHESSPGRSITFPQAAKPELLGVLEDYEVIRRIDAGGFGEVFEAFDTQLNRRVALKLLRVVDRDHKALVQFQREAQAAGSIHHENVVVLHRVLDPTDEFPYACLVMEYVKGGSLKQRMKRMSR